jgi:hypothetical protein
MLVEDDQRWVVGGGIARYRLPNRFSNVALRLVPSAGKLQKKKEKYYFYALVLLNIHCNPIFLS